MRIIFSDDKASEMAGQYEYRWWCEYLLDDGWVKVGPFYTMQDAKDHNLGEFFEPIEPH